jgi:hypothetical protein
MISGHDAMFMLMMLCSFGMVMTVDAACVYALYIPLSQLRFSYNIATLPYL